MLRAAPRKNFPAQLWLPSTSLFCFVFSFSFLELDIKLDFSLLFRKSSIHMEKKSGRWEAEEKKFVYKT